MPSDHEKEMLAAIEAANPSLLRRNLKYQAKLSFRERCQILGLDKMGLARPAVAVAFGIARPTIGYICNPSSPHYRDVRKQHAEMGHDRFMQEYIDAEVVSKVAEAARTMEAKATDAEVRKLREFDGQTHGPNKTAKGRAGTHEFWDEMMKETIVVDIKWLDEEPTELAHSSAFAGPAWYVVFTDGTPELWRGDLLNIPANFNTSSDAFNTFKTTNGYEVAR